MAFRKRVKYNQDPQTGREIKDLGVDLSAVWIEDTETGVEAFVQVSDLVSILSERHPNASLLRAAQQIKKEMITARQPLTKKGLEQSIQTLEAERGKE